MRINFDEDERIEVQMAPLIDCVFLLLIFFLVATSLKKIEKVVEVEAPISPVGVSRPVSDDMRVITIDEDNNVYWGAEPIGQGALMKKIRELVAEDPARRVMIACDQRTDMSAFAQVHGMCKFEGLQNVEYKTRLAEDHGVQGRRPEYEQ